MRLFAQQGYARTSIAQIEKTVGLRPGSGGLYRHFASKEAILEAGIASALSASDEARAAVDRLPRDDQRGALKLVAKASLRLLDRDRDLTAILFKDLDQFPSLRDEVRERWIQSSYDTMAAILRHTGSASGDYEAHAAVALGSLVLYHVLQVVLGEPPGRISERRFLAAWLDRFAPAKSGGRSNSTRRKALSRR